MPVMLVGWGRPQPFPMRAHLAANQLAANGAWTTLGPWTVDTGLAPAGSVWTMPAAGDYIVSMRLVRTAVGATSRPRGRLQFGSAWMPADASQVAMASGDGIGALMSAAVGASVSAQVWGTSATAQYRELTPGLRMRIDPYLTPWGAPTLVEDMQDLAPGMDLTFQPGGWTDHMYSSGTLAGGSGCLVWASGAGTYRSYNCYHRPGPGGSDVWVRSLIMMDPRPSADGYGGMSVVARHDGTSGLFGRITSDTWTIMRGASNTSTTADSPLASGALTVVPTVGDWLALTVVGNTVNLYVGDVLVGSFTGAGVGSGTRVGLGINRVDGGLLGRWESGIMP